MKGERNLTQLNIKQSVDPAKVHHNYINRKLRFMCSNIYMIQIIKQKIRASKKIINKKSPTEEFIKKPV